MESIVSMTAEDRRRMQIFCGTGQGYRGLSLDALEQCVTSLLKPNRVAHVLGCRDTAVALARHWGADEKDAARAGLLHDITKALDGQLQLTLCAEYGIILDDFSKENPKTLHALTGSLVAERIFGENESVVAAITPPEKQVCPCLKKSFMWQTIWSQTGTFPGCRGFVSWPLPILTRRCGLGLL